MYDFFYNVVVMAFVLGVMILVHEWGHYAAAKALGVRVLTFSIGFGPRLLGFRRGETDYRIALIPLGGYVKMAGETPVDSRTTDPGEFLNHPRWHRFLIALAGPAMNILLAIVLLTVVYMVRNPMPAYLDGPAVIGAVEPDSPAAAIGLRPGDRIVRIDNEQNPTWETARVRELISPNREIDLAVQRGNEIISTKLKPVEFGPNRSGYAGFVPAVPVVIGRIDGGFPAEKAGLRQGDEILTINGQAMLSIVGVINTLQETKGQPVTVTYKRNGQVLESTMAAVPVEADGKTHYRLGFGPDELMVEKPLPFAAAFGKSLEKNKQNSLLIVELVDKLVRGHVSVRQVEGPIGIARHAGSAAKRSGWELAFLMAAISLNLGIFNLLPIPILDGGVILLLAIEGLMRRDISDVIKYRIYQAAFVFLILFAALVIYNDIVKAVPSLSGRP